MSPRAGLSRQRIARAAAELADEVGFAHVTLSAVARRFGVKDPSLYTHVRNLRDLQVQVGLLAGAEMNERIGAAVAGRSGREALFAFADAYRSYALDHPGRYAATQIRMDPEEVAGEPALLRGIELTAALLRGYGLSEPGSTDAGRLLRSTFHGFATLEGAGGFAHSRAVDASWHRILEALHRTLSQWPSGTEEEVAQ